MGLPHRNYFVFKQADPNKQKVKERDPPSAVGGLEGSKNEEGNEGAERAPAD